MITLKQEINMSEASHTSPLFQQQWQVLHLRAENNLITNLNGTRCHMHLPTINGHFASLSMATVVLLITAVFLNDTIIETILNRKLF